MPEKRYEVKMTCSEMYLPDVRSWVRLHPEAFIEAYPPRQVNNLYFDTQELGGFVEHVNGASTRSKLRYRWYGEDYAAIRGTLELKHKSNQLIWKEYCPIPITFDLTAISWADFTQVLRQHAQGTMSVWLSAQDRPTLLNSYWREYYESIDHQVRITIDYAQKAYEQITHVVPNLTVRAPSEGPVVIELKADPSLHRRVSNVLSLLPMQVERNSKYVTGVQDALIFV
jgi:hypothetical protein